MSAGEPVRTPLYCWLCGHVLRSWVTHDHLRPCGHAAWDRQHGEDLCRHADCWEAEDLDPPRASRQLGLALDGDGWRVAIERRELRTLLGHGGDPWRWSVYPPHEAGAPSTTPIHGEAATRQLARRAAAEAIERRRPVHDRAVRKHRRRQQLEARP